MKPFIDKYCSQCGSRNVTQDAAVLWNAAAQDFEVMTIYDNGNCRDCGASGNSVVTTTPIDMETLKRITQTDGAEPKRG